MIPVQDVSHNPLLSALFGGILTGIGVAYPLKYGFSTGGMDIIAVILEKNDWQNNWNIDDGNQPRDYFDCGCFFLAGKMPYTRLFQFTQCRE
ncbi:YitT family protein [Secundilactobacillus kimchicus]|uniref:YitT family protein n=1 Tax=Secundilactobacillus kimchicus TaxID=528209 RepID=UPI003F73C90C